MELGGGEEGLQTEDGNLISLLKTVLQQSCSSGAAVHSVSALKCPFVINDNNEEFADEA